VCARGASLALVPGRSASPLEVEEAVVLSDVVRMLELLRTEQSQYMVPTIYAAEPWSSGSEALVDWASQKGGLPPEVAKRRMVRLIDVGGAVDLLKDRYFDLRAAGGYDELSTLLIQRVIVRPAKAGAFCGSQSHRGKSRSPVAWVAGSVGRP
jgi:hypothetical protein